MARGSKKVPAKELKENLSEPFCFSCREPRPGGPDAPLPHGWENHCINSAEYRRGYWLPLTCSNECRVKGGFRVSK